MAYLLTGLDVGRRSNTKWKWFISRYECAHIRVVAYPYVGERRTRGIATSNCRTCTSTGLFIHVLERITAKRLVNWFPAKDVGSWFMTTSRRPAVHCPLVRRRVARSKRLRRKWWPRFRIPIGLELLYDRSNEERHECYRYESKIRRSLPSRYVLKYEAEVGDRCPFCFKGKLIFWLRSGVDGSTGVSELIWKNNLNTCSIGERYDIGLQVVGKFSLSAWSNVTRIFI